MNHHEAKPMTIPIGPSASVSALHLSPAAPRALYVFAHGAGAGMDHAFMADLAIALAEREVATLRFQFPFMERGSRRTDPPEVAQGAVRAAVDAAARIAPGVPLFAGGKSFGGRMTSQAQAIAPLAGVRGLVFVGFPLHPAGKPATTRADHLRDVALPMLFLQGTRDELATMELIVDVTAKLDNAMLSRFDDADHAFHVRKQSGQTDRSTLEAIATRMAAWMTRDPANAAADETR